MLLKTMLSTNFFVVACVCVCVWKLVLCLLFANIQIRINEWNFLFGLVFHCDVQCNTRLHSHIGTPKSNSGAKHNHIVCALWFLSTIKILSEEYGRDPVRAYSNFETWWMDDRGMLTRASVHLFGLVLNFLCFHFDKVRKLHINMMPVHLLMYDNQLIIIRWWQTVS